MIEILAGLVGPKLAKPVMYGLGALLLIIVATVAVKCRPVDHTAERQAEQTSKSGAAIAAAASNAITTLENRTVTEKTLDAAVEQAQGNVTNAQDPNALRNAVLDGLCSQNSHRNDPACRVR